MENERMKQEIQEAILAGERALSSLYQAQRELKSAKNWGIYDMLGGGLLSTFIKHSRIDSASTCLEEAQTHLRKFQKELKDVQSFAEIHIEIGNFLTFADYFFDGLLIDCMVQSQIKEAQSQTEQAVSYVTNLLADLRQTQNSL